MKRCGKAESLTDLDVASCIKEYIVRLDVSMDDVLAMKMGKAFAGLNGCQRKTSEGRQFPHLVTYGRYLCFCDLWVIFDNISQRSSFHEFHHYP